MRNLYRLLYPCVSFFLLTLFANCQGSDAQQRPENRKLSKSDTALVRNDTLTVAAVGDMMLGSAFPSPVNLPNDDAKGSFKKVAKYLKGDIIFGNLEGCFLDTGFSKKCDSLNSKNCYAFRMPKRYGQFFKDAGFNLLSMANNHTGDFDHAGRKTTAHILDSLEINYAGQMNKPYAIFEKNGIKYGFIAFAPNENTVQLNDLENAESLCAEIKRQVDILLVSFHGGGEGAKFEHVTKQPEIFYKENRGNVYQFAHTVIDAGADLVLGHGPHVTRAVEVYKGRFIAYSLGNFCTYGMFNLSGPNGIAPLLQIKIKTNGEFISTKVISIKQDKINRLQLDGTQAAYKKIRLLTNADFPDNSFRFVNNQILPKP